MSVKMCTFKMSFQFAIFAIILIALNGVWGKRGCASFGHSCYGGHGKRSQGIELFPPDMIADKDINRHPSRDHEPPVSDQFSSRFDDIAKPENDFKSLLRKLAKSYEENQQLHSRYMSKYFNY